jgi:hypothetical protein
MVIFSFTCHQNKEKKFRSVNLKGRGHVGDLSVEGGEVKSALQLYKYIFKISKELVWIGK